MAARRSLFADHRARNTAHTAVLLGAMFVLFAAFGSVFFGGLTGVVLLGGFGLVSAAVGARMAPRLVLRMYRARPLRHDEAPSLHGLLAELARRAGLSRAPQPFYVPSQMINAFAVGTGQNAAIGITDGMLRQLDPRQIRGVLAHEVTHVANNDPWVMGLADFVTRTVNFFAWVGQITLLLSLPAILLGRRAPVPFTFILLLIIAPTLSALLQLALSRTREFEADVGAARLTHDPRGLASALAKMERLQAGAFEQIIMPGRKVPEPSLLRTHPPTDERVQRLLAMESELGKDAGADYLGIEVAQLPTPPQRAPRWHVTGTWY